MRIDFGHAEPPRFSHAPKRMGRDFIPARHLQDAAGRDLQESSHYVLVNEGLEWSATRHVRSA